MKIQFKNKGEKEWTRHRGALDEGWMLWLFAEGGRTVTFTSGKFTTKWRSR